MMKRIAIVTGASSGIGAKIAEGLARVPETRVVLVSRNEERCRRTQSEIISSTGNKDVDFAVVDLSSYHQIVDFAKRFKAQGQPLHILVNNVATVTKEKEFSAEGIELQFATNVLSYYWMIESFQDVLKNGSPSRVVNIAARLASDLDVTDLQFERRPYDMATAYKASKQANRMLASALAKRLQSHGVTVNAAHPGIVDTNLLRSMGFKGMETAEAAAKNPLWVATAPELNGVTGKFFVGQKEERDRFASNADACDALLAACDLMTQSLH